MLSFGYYAVAAAASVTYRFLLHGCPQYFFQGWAMRGSEGRKSPIRVQGQLPDEGLGAKPQKLTSKWCINTSYTKVLDNICSKKTLSTFSGGGQVPPCQCCRRPCFSVHAIVRWIPSVCLSVIPTRSGIVSKWMKIRPCGIQLLVEQSF